VNSVRMLAMASGAVVGMVARVGRWMGVGGRRSGVGARGPAVVDRVAALEKELREAVARFARAEEVEARIGALGLGLQDQFAAFEREMRGATAGWARRDEVEARFEAVESTVGEHGRRIDTTAAIVAALEKGALPRIVELEKRMEAQARSLDLVGEAMSEADGTLRSVLESIESLTHAVAEKAVVITPVAGAKGSAAQFVDGDAEMMRLLHIRL
jgi:hypothetical protein